MLTLSFIHKLIFIQDRPSLRNNGILLSNLSFDPFIASRLCKEERPWGSLKRELPCTFQ